MRITTVTAVNTVTVNTWDVLTEAADIIAREGHIKGMLHSESGHCAVGAIAMAVRKRIGAQFRKSYIENTCVRRVADTVSHYLGMSLPAWNDHSWRTASEVLATLHTVAALEKASGVETFVDLPDFEPWPAEPVAFPFWMTVPAVISPVMAATWSSLVTKAPAAAEVELV